MTTEITETTATINIAPSEKDIEQLWGPPTTDADKRADGERKAKPKQHPDDDIHIPDMLR